MPLTRGSRLGPYEIVSRAGAGGMGEVYRARDVAALSHPQLAVRLDRTVAGVRTQTRTPRGIQNPTTDPALSSPARHRALGARGAA
jgi:hypothetical protein